MPLLQVLSARPLAGKTTVAVALAQALAAVGETVQLVRTGTGEAAAADARAFAEILSVATPGRPVLPSAVGSLPGLTVLEADAGETPLVAAPSVLVIRSGLTDEDRRFGATLGPKLVGSIATDVAPGSVDAVAREMTDAGLRPLALLPEDRALAAASVGAIRDALDAEVLNDADNWDEAVEDIVVAPIYTDPARPHFRSFGTKAVLAPFYKTDLLISAIESGASCVVLTGGKSPSDYVINRVQGEETSLLLARQTTMEAVAALAGVWGASRLRGEAKAAAAHALVQGRINFSQLTKKLS